MKTLYGNGRSLWIVIALIVVGISLYAWRRHSLPKTTVDPQQRVLQLHAKEDLKSLQKPQVSDPELYSAMVRLAQSGDPAARKSALQNASHPSPAIRQAAANALGYYEDQEVLDALQKFLIDPDASVRLQALMSLGRGPDSAPRQALLQSALGNRTLPPLEKLEASTSLYKISRSPQIRSQVMEQLFSFASDFHNTALSVAAVSKIELLSFNEPRLTDLLEKALADPKGHHLVSLAIRHLPAVQKVSRLRERSSILAKDPDPGIRSAIFRSLPVSCPEDREKLLVHALLKEKDPQALISAIQSARLLLDMKTAQENFVGLRARKDLSSEQLSAINSMLLAPSSPVNSSACQSQAEPVPRKSG